MMNFANDKDFKQLLTDAFKSGKDEDFVTAMETFHASVEKATIEKMKADFEEVKNSNDAVILAQRGYRQLTDKENKWYQKVINALKSNNPKQAFTAIIGSENEEDLMPTTIIEDVYKNLKEEHPLLKVIDFQYVGYITKWILNDHSAQNAVWGQITDEIVKEITSSFKVVTVNQNKLSAYAIIENGMLDLGATFLDGYIRAVLAEAIMAGLEVAIVSGTGVKEPIGLIRDIHEGVSYSESTGYPAKQKTAIKGFNPDEYGRVLAEMAETESGRKRTITKVVFLCNQKDYFTKVMPATTVLTSNGAYANNLFPFPTEVIISNALEDGDAVAFIPGEYFMGMGGAKNGVIEMSEEAKFLEDQTVFKVKQYGTGRAFDNTSAVYLDISALEPAYIAVKDTTVTA